VAFLDLPGARIRYEVQGHDGPAVLLVHGGMCDLGDWRLQADNLARDHRVVACDLRCHGGSTGAVEDCRVEQWAADCLALADALGLGRVVLVGHSLASRIVLEAASGRPDKVAGVVLLDGSRSHGGFAASAPPPDAGPPPMQRTLAEILDLTIGPFVDAGTRARLQATMAATPPPVMQAIVEAMRAWDLERADSVLARLPGAMPLLAVQSTYHDAHTPRRSLTHAAERTPYLDWLCALHPGTSLRVLPETGHFIMLERPALVTGIIRDFARDAETSGPVGPAGENHGQS
jgi:pimeloyl-ACP methyl ester carboxylesterase